MYQELQRWGVRLLGLLLASSLMGAYCGRKSDLYLPKEKPAAPPAEQGAAPPPASPTPAPTPAAEPPPAPSTKVN